MYENEEEENNISDDLRQLVLNCVQSSNNLYNGTIEDQQKASNFINEWIQHPKAFHIGLEILKNFNDFYSNYAALSVFNALVSNNWNVWDIQIREELKYILYDILQSDRNPSIINMCSILIARIANNEFPEFWKDFLIDSLTKSNSLVLIYYLENLENSQNMPQQRRVLIHQIFINYFDYIKNAIFDRPDISPESLRLYSLLSKWVPLNRIIHQKAIELLTTTLLDNKFTRQNAIECLDVIFVQRCDCKDEFPRLHYLLLTNLYEASKKYAECAALMAKILCEHLDFFERTNEITETFEKPIDNITSRIEESGEEVLIVNIGQPKYEKIKVTKKSYPFYESFHHCFMILSNPGWCLNRSNDNDNSNKENEIMDEFQNSDGNNDNIDIEESEQSQSNIIKTDYVYGTELYWSAWRKFLSFADKLDIPQDENFILKRIPNIFLSMVQYIMIAADSSAIINEDARTCFSIMLKNNPQFVIQQLEAQNVSIQLLYVTCCCIEKMDDDYRNQFVMRFLNPNQDPVVLIPIIRCVAFLLRFLPNHSQLIHFFINMFVFSMRIQPPHRELQLTASFSLMYLSTYSPQVFYFEDFVLLKILVSLISSINPGPSLFIPVNQMFLIMAARVISSINDDEITTNYIKSVTTNITSFIYANYKTIIDPQNDSNLFVTFNLCINIINDFSRRCFKLAQVEGKQLFESCLFIIDSKGSKQRDLELIESCYGLVESIICCSLSWKEAEPLTMTFLKTSLSGEKSQFGFALKFLTNIHQKFKDSDSLFPVIYENIVQNLMAELFEGSQFVLDYLLAVKFWNNYFALPIEFMKVIIAAFPLSCIKPALIITKEYCINYQIPYIGAYISKNGENVFRFLVDILINSMFNTYFHEIVRCFMSFFFAINNLELNMNAVNTSLLMLLNEIFPNISINQLINEEFDKKQENVMNERNAFFIDIINSFNANYMDQKKMELILRNLVISSHCCLPTISNVYTNSKIQFPVHSFEMELYAIQQRNLQTEEVDIDALFNDVMDEDFDC